MQFELTNFQAYPKVKLNFAEKVTIIHGDSGAGKSSIIRALKQFFQNRPAGDDYRRDDTKLTTIKGTIDNVTVVKKRTKSKNSYQLGKEKFKALRLSVPDKLSSLFNIGEENIQSQDDFYFLIDESSGQVAKSLNVISDLSITDKSMTNLKTKIRTIKSDISYLEENIKKIEKEIKNLYWVNYADKDFSDILKVNEEHNEYLNQYNKLNKILTALKQHKKILNKFPVKLGNDIKKLDKVFSKFDSIKKEKRALKKLLKSLSEAEKAVSTYADINFELVSEIEEIFNAEERVKREKEKVKEILKLLKDQKRIVSKIKVDKIKAERKYRRIKKCPTCEQIICEH